jgi:hypothetical protein
MTEKNTMENSKKANGMQKYRLYTFYDSKYNFKRHWYCFKLGVMPPARISISRQLTHTTECKALIMIMGMTTNLILNYQGQCDKLPFRKIQAIALMIEAVRTL